MSIKILRLGKLERQLEIPPEVKLQIEGDWVIVSGPKGQLKRRLIHPQVHLELQDSRLRIWTQSHRRRVKAQLGTVAAQLRNMILGVTRGYEYRLRVVYAHFPIQLSLSKDGTQLLIQNFLGEKTPRSARILEGVKLTIFGHEIILHGIDREAVGQTAANIEQATRLTQKDRRVFQDGIYITMRGLAP